MSPLLCKQWLRAISGLVFLAIFVPNTLAAPLTLAAALASAESSHPDLLYAQAERDSAAADKAYSDSSRDTRINLEGALRSGRPSTGSQSFSSDNSVRLTARKTLYDFGRSSNAGQAAQYELNARDANLTTVLDGRRLEIMARYFDVLLADMQHTVDNEFMSVYFVRFDQGKDRFERGQISSVELAELESAYGDSLAKRNASAQRRRITRALLANAMNRPGNLPAELEDPKLDTNHRSLPDYEALVPVLLVNNSRLLSQRGNLAASQKRLESMRADYSPILEAEAQAAEYSRTAPLRDNLSAGLILSWPLYQGSKTDSRISRELAEYNKLYASTEKLKMELTEALLEEYLEITQLQGSSRRAVQKYADYRDLQLEKSRGLYELELKSNLGTSMVGSFEADMRARQIEYRLALSFARLEALLGKQLSEVVNPKGVVNE